MAKMFYSLEEAATRLNKSVDEVRQMAGRGQLTEFRNGDDLLFKVEQVDLLAGDDEHDISEMSSMIPLADSRAGGTGLGLGLADSGVGTPSPSRAGSDPNEAKEKSGIPVFDADELDLADPSAVTQVTETAIGGGMDPSGLRADSLGSGSGLMDLTRESDDTSLGAAGLLDELYPAQEDQGSAATNSAGGSGLFEGAPGTAEAVNESPVLVPVSAEVYDGPGSGLSGGLALGIVAALGFALAILLMSRVGLTPTFLASIGGENAPLIWTGIFAGATLVFGGLGFVLGKKSAA